MTPLDRRIARHSMATGMLLAGVISAAATARSFTGFEEGFAPGPIAGQQGWKSTYPSNYLPTGMVVSNANPYAGSAHLRLAHSTEWSQQNLTSPELLPPTAQASTISMQLSLHSPNPEFGAGATYEFFGYGPGMQIAWAAVFESPGSILISDAMTDGGGIGMVYASTGWETDAYREFRVEMDPGAGQVRFYYAGALLHTGSTLLASSMQFMEIIRLDPLPDFTDDNFMDIDNLAVVPGPGTGFLALAACIRSLRRRPT